MTDQPNAFLEYQLDLEAAIQLAIKHAPVDPDVTDQRLVNAISCWDEDTGQQKWVLSWMNEKQFSDRRLFWNRLKDRDQKQLAGTGRATVKGGGDIKVTVSGDGKVSFVASK